MIDFQKWIDRIENELELQKQLCLETARVTFTRRELIELRSVLNTLVELENKLRKVNQNERSI